MASLSLTFNNTGIRRNAEFLCLTDMWRAADAPRAKKPAHWLRTDVAQEFVEFIQDQVAYSQLEVLRVDRGGTDPGTWAHWQLAMAYAKYLSPEFHAWCNEVVRREMGGHSVTLAPAQMMQTFSEGVRAMHETMVLVREMIQEVRTFKEKPLDGPLTSDQVAELKRYAKRYQSRITPVWHKVCDAFGYKKGPVFTTVPARDFEKVREALRDPGLMNDGGAQITLPPYWSS